MRATRKTKWAFECPVCSEFHSDHDKPLEKQQGWSVEDLTTDGLTMNEPAEVVVFDYNDDGECLGEDEPEYLEAWMCGECEEVYQDRDEAKDCCKP